jgi:hypothetical protein
MLLIGTVGWIFISIALLIVAILLLFTVLNWLTRHWPQRVTPQEFAQTLERVIELAENDNIEGDSDETDFAFVSPIRDFRLEAIRQQCLRLASDHRPSRELEFCGPKGVEQLKILLKEVQSMSAKPAANTPNNDAPSL